MSNKWLWFAGGVAVGFLVAPKLRAWVPAAVPQFGR
jgi:hypothetical protein